MAFRGWPIVIWRFAGGPLLVISMTFRGGPIVMAFRWRADSGYLNEFLRRADTNVVSLACR